jgi:hypothetical protein
LRGGGGGLLACELRALELGVGTAFEAELVSGGDQGIVKGGLGAVDVAASGAATNLEADAVLLA